MRRSTLNVTGTPTEPAYVIATYGAGMLTPSNGPFATVNNLPLGYIVDYQYASGTAIAIVESTLTLYQQWAGGYGGLSDPDPGLDFDNGGLATGVEWVVGGDPSDGSDDASVAPFGDIVTDPSYLIFTYRRTTQAGADVNTAISVEYGSDLTGWTTAVDNGVSIFVDEFPNFYPGVGDKVEAAIDRALFPAGKLFARLKVVVTTP